MEVAFFWFFFSVICGIFAGQRGRNGFGYFLLAMFISPLLCFLLVAVLRPAYEVDVPNQAIHKRCPECAELVLKEARKCKHCGASLTEDQPPGDAVA